MSDHNVDPESILSQALGIASLHERSEFIERACGDDALLRARVAQLVIDAEATRSFFTAGSTSIEVTGEALTAGGEASRTTATGKQSVLPVIPGYEILEVLGRGGMGVVYKARQLNLKRLVALKLILAAQADDEGLSRFRTEAEAAARLQHPHIVAIHEVGEHNGQPYMAFEFIDGGSLADYLSHSSLSNEAAAEIVETLARAMHYAHTQGIVHRDLKPSNVLLSRSSSSSQRDMPKSHAGSAGNRSSILSVGAPTKSHLLPKISDFGLAKNLDADHELTRTGAVMGTPNYMAPEQAAAAHHEIGPATDVYSLGAILYALIAHQPPFRGSHLLETLQMVRKDEPTLPRKLQPKVARDLETICLKCLEKRPSSRYANAEALADDLRRYLQGEAITARPSSFAYRVTKLVVRHRTGVIVAAVTILMLMAGLITGQWYSSTSHQRTKEVLSDIKVLAELRDEYPKLLTVPYADRRESMEAWMDRSTRLTERLATHRATLEKMRGAGQKVAATGGVGEKWQFANATLQMQHDNLQQLVQGIESLRIRSGMIETVKGWASLAPFPFEIESQWVKACAAIEAAHAIRLANCDGLYALGPDPQSQLWEFVDLRFGLAPFPDEGKNGRFSIRPETGFVFVLLPGGSFRMGSPEGESGRKKPDVSNEQLHDVELSPFFISKHEVTQAQWEKVVGQNPSEHLGPVRAVHEVSWIDCDRFCQKTGLVLPTESQWEYACRAGTTGPYNVSAPLDAIGWYADNSSDAAHVIGEKLPNRFGLYDMHGNVLEWCQDAFAVGYYLQPQATSRDPVNRGDLKNSDEKRVLRGGSYEGPANYMRSADRYAEKPERRWRGFGVRPVRPTSPQGQSVNR